MSVIQKSPVPFNVVQSDSTIYEPVLSGIDVSAPGTVTIKNEIGTSIAMVFPAVADGGGSYPKRWDVRIRQIMDTGTDISDANLKAFRHA